MNKPPFNSLAQQLLPAGTARLLTQFEQRRKIFGVDERLRAAPVLCLRAYKLGYTYDTRDFDPVRFARSEEAGLIKPEKTDVIDLLDTTDEALNAHLGAGVFPLLDASADLVGVYYLPALDPAGWKIKSFIGMRDMECEFFLTRYTWESRMEAIHAFLKSNSFDLPQPPKPPQADHPP